MPRQWSWLEEQSHGVSGSLRRLVEQALCTVPGKERARLLRAALSGVLSSVAGDRPHYEDACRALFAGDTERFEALVARWPMDIRAGQAREAAAHATDETTGAEVVARLHEVVWSRGDYRAIDALVAPRYVIHADPGDPWEGRPSIERSTKTA